MRSRLIYFCLLLCFTGASPLLAQSSKAKNIADNMGLAVGLGTYCKLDDVKVDEVARGARKAIQLLSQSSEERAQAMAIYHASAEASSKAKLTQADCKEFAADFVKFHQTAAAFLNIK